MPAGSVSEGGPDDEAILAAWRADPDSFAAAVQASLEAGALDGERLARLAEGLDDEEGFAFDRAVMEQATRLPVSVDTAAADVGGAVVELFAIPALGAPRTLDGLVSGPRGEALARAVVATGFSDETSEVVLIATSLHPLVTALAEPQVLFDLVAAGARHLGEDKRAAAPVLTAAARELEDEDLADDPDAPTVRLLVGLRLVPMDVAGSDGLGLDSFFRDLRRLESLDEADAAEVAAALPDDTQLQDMAAHLHHMSRLWSDAAHEVAESDDVVLLPPVAWSHADVACASVLAGLQLPLGEATAPARLHAAIDDEHTVLTLVLESGGERAGPAEVPLALTGEDVETFASGLLPEEVGEVVWHEDPTRLQA